MIKSQTYNQKVKIAERGGVTYLLLFAVLGYITANTTITGGLSPLNVAIVACTGFSGGIACFATSLISYIFNNTMLSALPQICSMAAIIGIKFIFGDIWNKKAGAVISSLTSGALMVFFSVTIMNLGEFTYQQLFLRVSQSILCGCTVYFICTAVSTIKKEHVIPVSGAAGASLGVIYVVVLATLTSMDVASINFGRIVGILIMLLAVKKYKHLGGAVCGVLTSCGVILCSPVLGRSTMLLACAGLIAGLFADFGVFAMIISFLASNTVGLIAIGVTADTYPMLIDTAFATVIFILIPQSVWSRLLVSLGLTNSTIELVAQNAAQRLTFASRTLTDVKNSIMKVSEVMEKKAKEQDIASRVCENVCGKCKNNLICWESNFDDTSASFYKIERSLNILGRISLKDFPSELNHCTKNILLENEFNTLYHEINYQNKLMQKYKEMRGMLSDQFFAMEEMLDSLSEQLSSYSRSDNVLTKKVNIYLEKNDILNAKCCVYYNNYDNINIEIYLPVSVKVDTKEFCEGISDIVERELDFPRISTVDNITRIELWEKPQFEVETGASQLAGKRAEITGDSYEVFTDNEAQSYVVLSDGMGSGKRAQLDSLLTSSLISRLIRAGIGCSSAIRLINASMRVKAWEESFATVDISIINLYTGELKLIKAGASASYLLRGEQLKKIELSSLPIGIIQEVKPAQQTIPLKSGDIIITASDGVVDEALESIRQIALNNSSLDANELAAKMARSAKQYAEAEHCDDITIVLSKINKLK